MPRPRPRLRPSPPTASPGGSLAVSARSERWPANTPRRSSSPVCRLSRPRPPPPTVPTRLPGCTRPRWRCLPGTPPGLRCRRTSTRSPAGTTWRPWTPSRSRPSPLWRWAESKARSRRWRWPPSVPRSRCTTPSAERTPRPRPLRRCRHLPRAVRCRPRQSAAAMGMARTCPRRPPPPHSSARKRHPPAVAPPRSLRSPGRRPRRCHSHRPTDLPRRATAPPRSTGRPHRCSFRRLRSAGTTRCLHRARRCQRRPRTAAARPSRALSVVARPSRALSAPRRHPSTPSTWPRTAMRPSAPTTAVSSPLLSRPLGPCLRSRMRFAWKAAQRCQARS